MARRVTFFRVLCPSRLTCEMVLGSGGPLVLQELFGWEQGPWQH